MVYRFRTDNASNGSRDYEIFRVRWNGSQWVDKTSLYSSQDTIAALGHTIVNDRVRAYFVNNNKQLLVAEKTAGGNWYTHVLSKDKSIERINVKVKNNVEDIVYASAPTSQTSQSGQLFYLSVGHDLSNLPAPVNPVTFEAEALTFSSSGTVTNITDSNASANEYLMLQDNTINDWIEFVLPNLEIGTYSISMSYKTHSSRGITQLNYEGQHVGTEVDQYSTAINWPIATIGSFAVTSPGDKLLRFTVTGKHPNSTGYRISIDKIILD